MINILLVGVGGQGTVLAAKLLAQAAESKGWQVRTAETIGMAQRGGTVMSHVRMGNLGEQVHSPLIPQGTAQLIVAFEPGEGARALEHLAWGGVLVTARSAVQPVTAALAGAGYDSAMVVESTCKMFTPMQRQEVVVVDDEDLLQRVGNPRALNTMLLARALQTGAVPLTVQDLRQAIRACVKPQLVDINLQAVDEALL